MTLTGPVALAVLFGALLHASWNALIKSAADKELDTALIHSIGFFLALPLLLFTGLPAAASWPYLLASMLVHIGYYVALAGAYRHGELGLTYPVMRGCAPLLVALSSHALIGESISPTAWAGVAAVCAGVVLLGLSPASLHAADGHRGKALRFALCNAAIIAIYTIVDGLGVRASGDAAAYVAALFLFDGVPYLLLVLWRRGPAGRPAAWRYMAGRWRIACLGTIASLGSYGIALWAMTRAPVAVVAALRETSVLFAALIGTLWLKERFGMQRALGTGVVVAGVMALRFG
ncbi:MAG: DMT family transporter [Rhodocyclaceae bacterium]|nr:DMT family transporter [Pseudomonadota bacterium]MDQ7972729.1 DMT family transporter [Rhodocyclaceae bacterium]MDQ7999469.1 DMT family transporter [Pseudomonadota bacterium]MDQ8015566.1 DMT family transporter [Pseudomonadota bacterium]